MDETAMAFEMPHVRAAATEGRVTPDRISVRDYTREVEIGAFRSERGVTQRIRFNVVLEVSNHAAAEDDDVDKVISYDTIIEAIEAQLAQERINLLETLAERVAARCLADPRALRVFVRIEKLDRIPGALGVEIVRSRVVDEDAARLRPVDETGTAADTPRPRVVFLDAEAAAGPHAAEWRDALAGWGEPLILCLGPIAPQPQATSEADWRIGLLSIEQNAWAFADGDTRLGVAASRTELVWALRDGRMSIWAPAKMAGDARARPEADASVPVELALWLAREMRAVGMVMIGAEAPSDPGELEVRVLAADRPQDLGTLG